MRKEVLTNETLELLRYITSNETFDQFYLVGGTALALQLGHRLSIDLDYFTQEDFQPIEFMQEFSTYNVITNISRKNNVELIVNGTKLSFMLWAFPITQDFLIDEGLKMLHPIDIGLLKLLAIQGRHTRKDIVDLYMIDREIMPLDKLMDLFEEHFPKESFNIFDSTKQLFDVEIINESIMPDMLINVEFDEALKVVQKTVSRHLKKLIKK